MKGRIGEADMKRFQRQLPKLADSKREGEVGDEGDWVMV